MNFSPLFKISVCRDFRQLLGELNLKYCIYYLLTLSSIDARLLITGILSIIKPDIINGYKEAYNSRRREYYYRY